MKNWTDKILEKWNVVYAILFVVSSALFVDVWHSTTSVILLVIAIGGLIIPFIAKFINWMEGF